MKIVIGLGNPGEKYTTTRHNAGFLCMDFLQKEFEFEPFAPDKKMSADISSGTIGSEKVLLVKPTTFMNDSGIAAQALLAFYKCSPADIVVIHDEIDLPLGTYKTTLSSRSAGHNGVQNIIDHLGTQDFFRIRLGVGRPDTKEGACISIHDYVLQKFLSLELESLGKIFFEVKMLLTTRIA